MTNSPAILRVAVLATTVLSWVSDETNAFSIVPTTTNSFPLLVPPTRLQRTVSLRESPRDESSSVETVQVVDVEAAMEALEEQGLALDDEEDEEEEETDDQPLIQVVVQNDVSDAELLEEYTREELVSEVEEVILEGIGTQREEAKSDLESPQTTKKKTLAGDIRGKFVKGGSTISITEEHTTKEAAVSASLYMNPATERIASNLIISWEPEVAEILDQLVRVSNPDRPLMVGIVGIPGSG